MGTFWLGFEHADLQMLDREWMLRLCTLCCMFVIVNSYYL